MTFPAIDAEEPAGAEDDGTLIEEVEEFLPEIQGARSGER